MDFTLDSKIHRMQDRSEYAIDSNDGIVSRDYSNFYSKEAIFQRKS